MIVYLEETVIIIELLLLLYQLESKIEEEIIRLS